ncbi:hypothetical protein Moror_6056 [Moniliophthora roreri MCA 2997]|uniref:Uncharacterized protein n=1 Tax=Moniliophthora roreri (strain MCA 2997) TaxID=1381753 RepID=V2W8G6_MONRO|nr:hypothetical protein Moror_6056 [Moniliophthora roreri MCA 2997]
MISLRGWWEGLGFEHLMNAIRISTLLDPYQKTITRRVPLNNGVAHFCFKPIRSGAAPLAGGVCFLYLMQNLSPMHPSRFCIVIQMARWTRRRILATSL